MVRQWYPDGEQPRTAAPVFIPIGAKNYGEEPATTSVVLTDPVLLQVHCATQGASIAYTFEQGAKPRWLLYTEPLRLKPGNISVRAKAARIGYRDSEETQVTFAIKAA